MILKFEDIKNQWDVDSVINKNDLIRESLYTSQLHAKYLEMLMEAKRKIAYYNHELAKMKNLKSRYYRGELSQAELLDYSLDQYQYAKPLKADMESKLEADDDVILAKQKIEFYMLIQFQLESIMKAIQGRGWDIKNSIEYMKFTAAI